MEHKYVCPCLLGIEGLVADELRYMGANNVEAQNGRVIFSGDYNILAKANICSRYSERVLVLLGSFKASSFEELFENVKSLPWENWIGKDYAFPVKGNSLNSKLRSVPDCQAIIKKAIVERLKSKYKIEWFDETGPLSQVQFLIMKDIVSVMIDTSGDGLHKRGYRLNSVKAPIKETLAAAMVKLAHVRYNSTLIDPFCGSGTILIEAAMYALNMAPGVHRKFAAENWEFIDKSIWIDARQSAIEGIRRSSSFKAYGFDIDSKSLEVTKENARRFGLEDKIVTRQMDIKDFSFDSDRTVVICNPPYGERLLDVEMAQNIYKIMGKKFNRKPSWSYYIITPDKDFETLFGRVADKRRKLYNGMIKCQFHMYFK